MEKEYTIKTTIDYCVKVWINDWDLFEQFLLYDDFARYSDDKDWISH